MANLSNINGKFVVEQTTGYVGVGTTDPNFLIEAAGANSEIALNSTSGSIYRVRSTSSDAFIITKNGVGDRLVIDGAGNSTFAGDVNVQNNATRIISLNYEDSVNSIISHSGNNFGLESLNVRGDTIRFYTDYDASSPKGNLTLTLDTSHNATFEGTITATGRLTVNTGGGIAAYFNGNGSNYTQGAITLQSSNESAPEARGQGVFMYNQGTDTTWYTGTTYNNADRFIIGRATNASLNTEAARANNAFVTVLNSGQVGIGTTSPTSPAGVARFLEIQGSTAGIVLHDDGNDPYEIWASGGNLVFRYNNIDGEDGMLLSASGKLGIGNTSPSAKLSVTENAAASKTILLTNNYATGVEKRYSSLISQFSTTDSSFESGFRFLIERATAGNYGSAIGFMTELDSAGKSFDYRMYIKNDKVGIGTTSPSEKLTLQLDAQNQAFSGKNGTDYLWFLRNEAGAGARQSCRFQLMDTDVTTVNIESASNRDTYFNAGKVGMGTTVPTAGLEVFTSTGGAGVNTLRLNTNFANGNAVDINPFITGANNGGLEIKLNGAQKLAMLPSGNVGIGTISPGDAKLYVNGGTTLGGSNNSSEGATRIFGDRKLPQASNFVKRNYNLTASSSGALYSIARQWHDTANWGLGNINVIMWGIYYGRTNFSKADFSCRYGYSGNVADVEVNFNPGGLAAPSWTAATQVSGNIYYRDLRIQIPAYTQISFEIISPGLHQTYNVNNTANNTVYLFPH